MSITPKTFRGRVILGSGFVLGVTALLMLGFTYALMTRAMNADPETTIALKGPMATGEVGGPALTFDAINTMQTTVRAATLAELVRQSVVALVAAVVVGMVLARVIAGRVTKPLSLLTRAAATRGHANLGERISLDGPEEVTDLADTFNGMLARLQNSFEGRELFMANVSHELRTPLTLQRTLLDVVRADRSASLETFRAVTERAIQAVDRMESLIDGLEHLSVAGRLPPHDEVFDLAELVRASLAQTPRDIELQVQTDLGPAHCIGNLQLVARLVENVLDNAVKHNVSRGWIHIATESERDQAKLVVENSGPEIDPGEVARLFEPFARGDGYRTRSSRGSGLGLAIVASIVRAHCGNVEALALSDGGFRITIGLPLGGMQADRRGDTPTSVQSSEPILPTRV